MNSIIGRESGFFKQKHVQLCENLLQNEINQFESLINDEDRFQYVFNIPLAYECEVIKSNKEKCEKQAMYLKEMGNKAFQQSDYKTALEFYNKAILKCPHFTENNDFAVLRGNRSAALYHLGLYKDALNDIESATITGFPKDMLYKLLDRKARCLLALKQHQSALKALRETLQCLDNSALKTERKQKWQTDIQIMIAMISKAKARNESIETTGNPSWMQEECNSTYKALSKRVTIKQGNEVGRYAEAQSEIKVGDILLIEDAHCAVLLEEHTNTHCFQCFRRLLTPIPCPNCCEVAFCSESCSKKALNFHHSYECAILPTIWASGASVTCMMALRLITQKPLSFFTTNKFEEYGTTSPAIYQGPDYETVYNLVRHESKRTVGDLLHRAHMAVFLFRCLEEAGYFKEEGLNTEDILKQKVTIGGLILRQLQLVQFNAHEVSELHIEGSELEGTKSIFIGGAIYPTLALFNHSCNPSLTRYFVGTKVIARAIRNLRKGEMIAENYGPIFTQMPKKVRQETLRTQYWFDCNCKACSEQWPVLNDMDPNVLRFRCEAKEKCSNVICVSTSTMDFMLRCGKCSQWINIMKGLKVLQDSDSIFRIAKNFLIEGDIDKALKKFIELLSILDETLAPPFRDYHNCQQAIRTCFLTLGNKWKKETLSC